MSAPTREPLDELALLRAENDRLRGLLEARWPVDLVKGQRAPFPYFGNKRIAAPIMWAALGNPGNLVIPFAGSLAELWARPEVGKVETINDGSGLVANVWRAIQRDPEAVAVHADHPVIELDLHAWHRELVAAAEDLRAKLQSDPRFYDAELAGRWIWGASAWLGSGWCDGTLPLRRPEISGGSGRARNGHGVHGNSVGDRALHQTRPDLGGGHGSASTGTGVHKTKLPRLIGSNGGAHLGNGVNSSLPALAGSDGSGVGFGSGVHSGTGRRLDGLVVWMRQLADRLRLVRITCGDFSRVLTPAVTISHGLTGVILDPPYGLKVRTKRIYDDEDAASMEHEETVAQRAAAWAREVGEDPLYRIVLCGYEGEHEMPSSWWCVPWTARGGYGLQAHGRGRENREKERLWFSPGCIREASGTQFLLPGLG
ncbi:hypothetical protein [uncultured Zoogloea sp.]|uniref:hypothetical protein n=1 Tax=uncultured Zoogloea sp. TaxID=160237 RepID=UPI0026380270|nr:hypothetical protein [uncultured Zoogloea sp.]